MFVLILLQAFEDYLVGLLQKPSLKESDILFTFLTSKEEFALAATNLGLGKIMKNVPIKLTKEKGQSLQTFIDSFLAQTQQPPPKPRYARNSNIVNVQFWANTTRGRFLVIVKMTFFYLPNILRQKKFSQRSFLQRSVYH